MIRMKMVQAFVISAMVLFGASAAYAGPVQSLNELPKEWKGVAGDLFTQVEGAFSVGAISNVTREEVAGGLRVTYDVNASLRFGERTLNVTQVILKSYTDFQNVTWLDLRINDALVPVLQTAATYDEASDKFTLREVAQYGIARRFVLEGKRD